MTRIDVLNDAIAYFWGNESRFCAINGSCQYKATETSEGCAIGRLLSPELVGTIPQSKGVKDQGVYELLPSEIRSLGVDFLAQLQDCHDSKYFVRKDRDLILDAFAKLVDTNQIIFPN